ncbi:unnamed protein product [Rotaria magnacalcarata]|uniref:Uncharacterized protein n=1 Tax=Rotaria magnacalcarata TaxID=392030 RepID=A0A819WBG4_9BILA|nr:unnamed protein product [Rotaria magnacalcarata]
MLRFKSSVSKKIKAHELQRRQQREMLNHLFGDSDTIESDDEINPDSQSAEREPIKLSPSIPSCLPSHEVMNYENDLFDNVHPFDDYLLDMDNSRPLFNGSSITVKKAVHQLCSFFTDFNINKSTVVNLLRIIKTLLPKPNQLTTSWKGIMKVLGRASTSRTTFLCSSCLKQCEKGIYGTKLCHNEKCSLKNRTMKSTEIVELVHLDIRAQIQAILTRNQLLLNRKDLYPMTDVCFGEYYRTQSSGTINRVTLIVHTDGAPLVKLSKQSIWPCFASLVELPPPAREYQKNIVLLSLWTSKLKPDPNIFLQETIEELKSLINAGTSIFINGQEYEITLRTQYFVSDLPAKALFCKTINFNGYSACSECCSTGEWSTENNVVVYPFTPNNLTPRTRSTYLNAAKEAQTKSIRGKAVSIGGIKGLSTLLQIFEYPCQIVFDYMHLVCLGHVPSLIKRWCQNVDKSVVNSVDASLNQLRLPHNLNIPFLDSVSNAGQWKAKKQSFIRTESHGSKHLGAQISYWIDLQTMIQTQQVKAPTIAAINEIKWLDGRLSSYQAVLSDQLASYKFDVYSFMYTTNTYAKPYLNRRTNTEAEMYNLVLFPSDNSIAVVKVKQCSPAEHDGFIFVQSGKKKFMGVILEEGTLSQCSRAADQLAKKTANPEIESDYERSGNENQSKQHKRQNSNNQQPITSTITISTERTNCTNSSQSLNTNPSMINNDNVLIGLQPTTSSVETCLSRSQIAHKSSKNDHKNMSNLKHKRHKKSHNVTSSAVLFDQFNNMNNESSDSEDELINNSEHRIDTNELSSNGAPKFVGCHITGENNRSKSASGQLSSSTTQQLSTFMNKLESQYLRPLLVGQERIEERIKCLFANQKKIQNVLRKQKVNISLLELDEKDEPTDYQIFLTSMEYKNSDGTIIDLLQRAGVKEHANRYVTSLMDIIFRPEQLLAIETKDISQHELYLLLKEAVKNKFRLSKEELETMWIWLHNVILAKRRTINSKRKRNESMNQAVDS